MTLHRVHGRVRTAARLDLVGREEAEWLVRLLPAAVLVVLWAGMVRA